MRSGNGAGDPSPAFDRRHGVALMAQLENVGGQGGPFVSQGDVSVSRSTDGGRNWSQPVTVFKGQGAGIGPANQAVFYDKEWLTVDNHPDSPHYGRAYVTTSRFLNAQQGAYAESPIYLSWSDDGGVSWSAPAEISGSHPSCTFQTTGTGTDCDEDQFSIPEVAANGDLYVHFFNGQNEAAWEVALDFDSQIMITRSTDGGQTFGAPVPAAQLEDGVSDMPWSVIARQTVWGHQIRWNAAGNLSVNPNDPNDVTVVFADRGTPNPNASDACVLEVPGGAPAYDPCNAGPSSDTNVYTTRSPTAGRPGRAACRSTPPPATSGPRGSTTSPTGRWRSPGTRTSKRPAGRSRSTTSSSTCSGPRPESSRSGRRAGGRLGDPLGRPVRAPIRLAGGLRAGRLQRPAGRRRRREGLQRLPRRLHRPGGRLARPGPRGLDGPEPARRVTATRPVHGRPAHGYVQDAMYARR
jgi:hypothetical protein